MHPLHPEIKKFKINTEPDELETITKAKTIVFSHESITKEKTIVFSDTIDTPTTPEGAGAGPGAIHPNMDHNISYTTSYTPPANKESLFLANYDTACQISRQYSSRMRLNDMNYAPICEKQDTILRVRDTLREMALVGIKRDNRDTFLSDSNSVVPR
eukprot:UN33934